MGAPPCRRMHLERSGCMADYPLLCLENHFIHTALAAPKSIATLRCLFVFYILIISQCSHHPHFNLSKWSLKGTSKKILFIYWCVPLWKSKDNFWVSVLSSITWVCGDQTWIIRHENTCLCMLNYLTAKLAHWPTIIFNGSLVKIFLGLHYLVHCDFLYEVQYTENYRAFEISDIMLHH